MYKVILAVSILLASCGGSKKDSVADCRKMVAQFNAAIIASCPSTFNDSLTYQQVELLNGYFCNACAYEEGTPRDNCNTQIARLADPANNCSADVSSAAFNACQLVFYCDGW